MVSPKVKTERPTSKRRVARWHRRERPNDIPSRTPHPESYPTTYLTYPYYEGHHTPIHRQTDWHLSTSILDVCMCASNRCLCVSTYLRCEFLLFILHLSRYTQKMCSNRRTFSNFRNLKSWSMLIHFHCCLKSLWIAWMHRVVHFRLTLLVHNFSGFWLGVPDTHTHTKVSFWIEIDCTILCVVFLLFFVLLLSLCMALFLVSGRPRRHHWLGVRYHKRYHKLGNFAKIWVAKVVPNFSTINAVQICSFPNILAVG